MADDKKVSTQIPFYIEPVNNLMNFIENFPFEKSLYAVQCTVCACVCMLNCKVSRLPLNNRAMLTSVISWWNTTKNLKVTFASKHFDTHTRKFNFVFHFQQIVAFFTGQKWIFMNFHWAKSLNWKLMSAFCSLSLYLLGPKIWWIRAHQLEGVGPRQRRRPVQNQETYATTQADERILRSCCKYIQKSNAFLFWNLCWSVSRFRV